jgi:hypothetical protein
MCSCCALQRAAPCLAQQHPASPTPPNPSHHTRCPGTGPPSGRPWPPASRASPPPTHPPCRPTAHLPAAGAVPGVLVPPVQQHLPPGLLRGQGLIHHVRAPGGAAAAVLVQPRAQRHHLQVGRGGGGGVRGGHTLEGRLGPPQGARPGQAGEAAAAAAEAAGLAKAQRAAAGPAHKPCRLRLVPAFLPACLPGPPGWAGQASRPPCWAPGAGLAGAGKGGPAAAAGRPGTDPGVRLAGQEVVAPPAAAAAPPHVALLQPGKGGRAGGWVGGALEEEGQVWAGRPASP